MEPTSEQLLLEMGWVHRLARALVRDDSEAADVAQETWLIAASERPDASRPLRPWLARVVRNLVRGRRRGQARRDLREAEFEQVVGKETATPAELAERVELQRIVAGEVLALGEPYRSTILLHFVEGLRSVEIAERLGVPEGTVRRRLKTALDRLRAQLQARKDQPGRGWLAALVPLAQAVPPAPSPLATMGGALIVKKLIAIAVVLVLVVGGAVVWKVRGGGRRTTSPPVATGPLPLRPISGRDEIGHVLEWGIQDGAPARRIAGHVVSDGAPVGGATVRLGLQVSDDLVQPLVEVTAGADGAFDFGIQPAARFLISAQAEGHAAGSVMLANADPRVKADHVVVVVGDCRWRMDGTVSDASGGVIAHARLSLDGLDGPVTDASGHYSFCMTPRVGAFEAAQASVRIEADGYGATSHHVILASRLHKDFILVPEAVLVGRVVTPDDQPVAGARVIAKHDPDEGLHHVADNWGESDPDGHFRIAGLAPGKFHLSATARSSGSSAPQLVIARAADTSKEIRLVVVPLARIKGRVVMNGAPVAGARVEARAPNPGPIPQRGPSATSQADGTFTLDGVNMGTIALSASPYGVTTPKTLDVKKELIEGVVVDVGTLVTLRGRVLRKGKPIAGAEVQYMPFTPQTIAVKSDENGVYVLEGLHPGDAVIAALSVQAKAFAAPRQIHLEAGKERTEDVDLDSAGEVVGNVVDQAGKPVPDVYVRMDLANGDADHCEAMTDASGNFDCADLFGGEYAPSVAPAPSTGLAFAPAAGTKLATITVPKDGVVTGVRLAIKNERLAIRGSVVDDTGAPVADVHVEAIGHGYEVTTDLASTMSDASGTFTINNLAPGVYSLHAHAGDGSETEVPGIKTGTNPVTIRLVRPGAIQGTLAGFSTTPLVETRRLTNTALQFGAEAIVDGNTFSQIGLPPGRYLVQAKAGPELDGVAVDVRSGETAHISLKSRGTGRVEGTVTELGARTPVAGMRCAAKLSLDGQMPAGPPDDSGAAITDAAGHFSLATPLGRVRVFCFNPPLSAAGIDVDVSAGTVPHVDLVTVRGTFGDPPPQVGFNLMATTLPITVFAVDPAGPAAGALAAGDHLMTIDGQSLQGMLPMGVDFLLFNHRAGSTITIGLERGGQPRTAKITVR